MKLLIFCPFGLKTPIHAPKIGVFGGFHPQNGQQCQRNPQKAHLRVVTVLAVYVTKKKKKKKNDTFLAFLASL